MTSVTWAQVRTRRLDRCGLLDRARDIAAAARDACGVHAQVQASAEIQLAIRSDATQAEVRDALWGDRSLVKAWTLRGTLHLHPAEELGLWHAATRDGAVHALEEWRDPNRVLHPALSAEQVAAAQAEVLDALGDRALTREELAAAVRDPVAKARLRSGFAFFTGGLVQGPPQGARVTLARPDRWIRGYAPGRRADAVVEACRRFLRTYGPARPSDVREWLGADAPLDEADVEEIDVEGRRAFVLAGDTTFPAPARSVRLLPEYDVYVMASREREQLVPERVRAQVAAHGRGRYEGPAGVRFLLVDGVAAGLWERKKRGKRLEIAVQPTLRLTKAQRAELESEAERIARCFALEPALTVTI